jgi:UDP-GlcNAc:undecaprenyl-phosphate/decaprenyl-phosphate GlcNAc-1-phosphate transferase
MYLLIPFLLTLVAVFLLIKLPSLHLALDLPNHRSLHTNVVPRTGGLGLVLGVTFAGFAISDYRLVTVLCLALLCISLLDDIRGLPVYIRFLIHFLVATIFVITMLDLYSLVLVVIVVGAIVWMINLYNFMDGSDGLAGGMALFGFGTYALAAYLQHDIHLAWISAAIVAASSAFLMFNFSPAKIFMGDVGSIPLGFLAAALGFLGWRHQIWQLWFPILVFSPFIVDATVTLLKRLLRGEKVWQAHKEHYYQRMIQMGFSHKKTALFEYVLMLAVGMSAVFLMTARSSLILTAILLWVFVYFLLMRIIDCKWNTHTKSHTLIE